MKVNTNLMMIIYKHISQYCTPKAQYTKLYLLKYFKGVSLQKNCGAVAVGCITK